MEQAAGEAARAAALAAVDREMTAVIEAQCLKMENRQLKKSRVRAAVICFFSGLAFGAGGIAILQGVR
jgi:hypothetical protein